MDQWILSGKLVQLIMAITAMEVLVLFVFHRITGRGIAPKDYFLNVLSGLFLMMAVWFALAKQTHLIALFLMAAGVAHVADLVLKYKKR
jgi:predicted membrane protein